MTPDFPFPEWVRLVMEIVVLAALVVGTTIGKPKEDLECGE